MAQTVGPAPAPIGRGRRAPQPNAGTRVYGQGSTLSEGSHMTIRIPSLAALSAVAALSLGVVACTEAEQEKTEANAEVAADNAEVTASQAADKAGVVAAQAGEVIESGAMKAAQAVETGAGNVADRLEANQAEAAAQGRPGAVDPTTDQRVPAPAQ
jgi:hypothetical protein